MSGSSLCSLFVGWFPAKFVEILDERSKEVLGNPTTAKKLDMKKRVYVVTDKNTVEKNNRFPSSSLFAFSGH